MFEVIDILANQILEALSKADLVGPSYSGLDPASLPIAAGMRGTGNWAVDTAVLGLQAVMHGWVDNNPPPGRIAHRIPESRKYSDYAQVYQDLVEGGGAQIAQRWEPTLQNLQSTIDAIHLMITYQPPASPVVAVDLNKHPVDKGSD